MNLLNSFLYRLSLLDVAFGPPTISIGEVDPVTKVIVILVLLAFLAFVGYLIWKSIRRKDDM